MKCSVNFCMIFSFFLWGFNGFAGDDFPKAPHSLTCEYLVNPLGIDESAPRLSWKINDSRRGAVQSAFQILVSDDLNLLESDQGNIWDAGKVFSDRSIQIPYAGKPLKSGVRYFWKVRAWDAADKPSPYSQPALWQMGLRREDDWKAHWIGFGGRLPKPERRHNGYHSQIAHQVDAVKWVVIDLEKQSEVDSIQLYPAHPFNWMDAPGFLFPVRFRLDVSNDPGFESFETVLDAAQKDYDNPGDEPQEFSFDGVCARYIRLYVTKLACRDGDNFGFALAEMQVLANGKNLAYEKVVTGMDSIEDDSWSQNRLTDGVTRAVDPGKNWTPNPSPMLRKDFSLTAPVARATLTASALGLYEIHINGERIGDNILAPEWTDYTTRIQYQTYDVSPQIREGKNAIGAILGEGWYAGRVGLMNSFRIYGDQLALLAQLDISCTDGSRHVIVSDSTWRGTLDGPIRGADIIHGEIYDSRMEKPNWSRANYDDANWGKAVILPCPPAKLTPQPNEPIQKTEALKPLSVAEPQSNVFVYDFGQNLVGWCSLSTEGESGDCVKLRYAEVVNPDGTIYTDNLRGPFQIDEFILNGEKSNRFEPRFTYHGFRFLEITGLKKAPPLDHVTAYAIHSAPRVVGKFECSDPMLNKLMSNILWTQRGNMHSTPTDCPQRDERLGWMGDAQIFSQAACFNMNMPAFYTKWLQDIRDAQTEKGQYSDFSPNPIAHVERFVGAPAWADAGIIIPWRMYENYADKRILERHYESMQRWIAYVQNNSTDFIWTDGRGNDYGDWLNADTLILDNWPKEGGGVSKEQIATAFAAHSADLLSRAARALHRKNDAQTYSALFQNIRNAYVQKYFDENGRSKEDNQTAYALALHFNLLPPDKRESAMKHLLRKIEDYHGSLSTGIQATNRMMLELSKMNQTDIAYQLLIKRTIPSWGYMVDHGATTIWERWDGWVDGRGFQNPGMNSFNHYALGAVAEWMYRNIAGINPDPTAPGYKHFIIHPRPGGGLTHAKASYDSIHGVIATEWHMRQDRFTLDATIPANTSAEIVLPARSLSHITENARSISDIPCLKAVKSDGSSMILKAPAGKYSFQVSLGE
ncbi:MAG: family 78 glycoside hydrolase catalytic domain [Candidatus Omnitrophica bacterium]|nr:family 78 glycoside hydrolase catalytic domain [Candidatus Omnitrophota bacterium]